MKKKVLCIVSFLLAALTLIGCGGGGTNGGTTNGGNNGNNSKPAGTTNPFELKVFNFNGGYGSEWLETVADRYEKEKAGKEFTLNGKTYDGVDVVINAQKKTLADMYKNYTFSSNHVYFHEAVQYLEYMDSMFEDMTEALTKDNPYETGTTLESKLSVEQRAFYNVDGKYYGVPHYAGYVGINYDIDLFNKEGYWLKAGYTYDGNTANLEDCFTKIASEKSVGPDGQKGTDDDGLPTTYDEFFMLCTYIAQCGNKPLTWDNKNRGEYLNWFTQSLVASYEGAEQMSLNYTFEGTAENLITVSDDGVITKDAEALTVNEDNAYELARQAGKYYALTFIEKIADNDWYYESADQLAAQDNFIETLGDSNIAMLVDGVWWENEADGTFNTQAQIGMPARKDRNYGFMPLPAATTEQAAERAEAAAKGESVYSLLDTHNSLCFIGKGIDANEKDIAIDFIQFCYTDESLVEFTTITDTTKAVNYTVSDADKAKMSTYGKSIITMQEQSQVVHSFSKNSFYREHESTLAPYKDIFNATIDGATAGIPFDKFQAKVSAAKYFNGLYAYKQAQWNTWLTK